MFYEVAYRTRKRPRRLGCSYRGVLSLDDTYFRIDGPVTYRADYSEVQWLSVTNRPGLFYLAIGSSPTVFVTPLLCTMFGIVRVISPELNKSLHGQLLWRVHGLTKCGDCGSHVRPSAFPCPQCTWLGSRPRRSGPWVRFLIVGALALLLVLYVGSYFYLSRRGMQEAKKYNMPGFLYVPLEEVSQDKNLTRHYFLSKLYYPLNKVDQLLLHAKGPIVGMD
jgi:hypothetical protein